MNFSGAKFRSLVDRSGITFSFNGSISNASGSGVFGFSGEGTKCGFSFYGGKIYDPNNVYFSSYSSGENFTINGAISGSKYQYSFNGYPVSYAGTKTPTKIQGFYLDSSGCSITSDIKVDTDKYEYSLAYPSTFTHTGALSGTLSSVDSNYNFQVFSGKVNSPKDFIITGLETSRTGSLPIKIQSTGQTVLNKDYTFEVDLYTNFGTISKDFTSVASLQDPTEGSSFDLVNSDDSLTGGALSGYKISVSSGTQNYNFQNYTLEYDLYKNYSEITSKPITVSLKHSSGTTGIFYDGHKVTGVQMANAANLLFTGTPTVTFTSDNSNDSQASGTVVMKDFMTARLWYSGAPASPVYDTVTFKTIVGVNLTSSGEYMDPTKINIGFSGGEYSSYPYIFGAYVDSLNVRPSKLSSGYSQAVGSHEFDNTLESSPSSYLYTSGTYDNILYLFDNSIKSARAVPLTATGDKVSRVVTGMWDVSTGAFTGSFYNFNTQGFWSGVTTGESNEVNHPQGDRVVTGSYFNSSTTSESNIKLKLRYVKPTAIFDRYISGSDLKIINNYLTGSHTKNTTYGRLYENPPSISKSYTMKNMPVINKIKEVVTGQVLQGSPASVDIKYSYIQSGTSGDSVVGGEIRQVGDYLAQYPALSFADMTGMFGSSFDMWKGAFEFAYTGLTLNFINLGLESTTGTSVGSTYAVGTNNIGDIRIGASTGINISHVNLPVSGNNFGTSGSSGSNIFLSTAEKWRNETSGTYYDDSSASYIRATGFSVDMVSAHSIGLALGISNQFNANSVTHTGCVTKLTNLYNSGQNLWQDAGVNLNPSSTKTNSTEKISGMIGCDVDAVTYLYGTGASGSHSVFVQKSGLPLVTGEVLQLNSANATLHLSGSGSLNLTKTITGVVV